MIHPILTYPDPVLRETSRPVERVTHEIRQLLDDMLETMYAAGGRGLAAVQIGRLERVVVIDLAWKQGPRSPRCYVNPQIVWRSGHRVPREERCLSIPDTPREVHRADQLRLRYHDREGEAREIDAEGWLAVALQHEVDHLDGVLILDRP